MIVEFVAFLLAGAFVIVIFGHLARWVASYFVSDDVTPVAGFSFVLGGVMLGANRGMTLSTPAVEIGLHIGLALGLVLLWWLFFRRERANG